MFAGIVVLFLFHPLYYSLLLGVFCKAARRKGSMEVAGDVVGEGKARG